MSIEKNERQKIFPFLLSIHFRARVPKLMKQKFKEIEDYTFSLYNKEKQILQLTL